MIGDNGTTDEKGPLGGGLGRRKNFFEGRPPIALQA